MGPIARGLRRPSTVVAMMAAFALTAPPLIPSSPALAASKPPSFPIPASERLGNATAKASKTATATTTATTPASALPTPSASPTPNPGAATTTPSTIKPSTPVTTTPATTTPAGATAPRTLTPAGAPLTTARRARAGSSHLSTSALIVAIVAALVALASAIWVLIRWLAPEPRWTRSLVYSVDEASSRASATWAEFTDWVRLGH